MEPRVHGPLAPPQCQKQHRRENQGLAYAHQLSSCTIYLLIVTFRLSVAQRGEQCHHCIRQPSRVLYHVWRFWWHKKAREVLVILIYLSCTGQKVFLCSQCWFELHGLTRCSTGINVTNSLTSSCCLQFGISWPIPRNSLLWGRGIRQMRVLKGFSGC